MQAWQVPDVALQLQVRRGGNCALALVDPSLSCGSLPTATNSGSNPESASSSGQESDLSPDGQAVADDVRRSCNRSTVTCLDTRAWLVSGLLWCLEVRVGIGEVFVRDWSSMYESPVAAAVLHPRLRTP